MTTRRREEHDRGRHSPRSSSFRASSWAAFVALGVALAVLGIFAIGAASLATLASMFVLGWVLIIGGVLQVAHAFYQRRWGGRLHDVLTGALFVVVGALAVWHPVEAAVSVTLVIAAALLIRGAFAIVSALIERYLHWGLTLGYGVVSILLGFAILVQWPQISMFFVGLVVGIELLVDGIVLAAIGIAARKAHRRPPREPARAPAEEARAPGEPLPAT